MKLLFTIFVVAICSINLIYAIRETTEVEGLSTPDELRHRCFETIKGDKQLVDMHTNFLKEYGWDLDGYHRGRCQTVHTELYGKIYYKNSGNFETKNWKGFGQFSVEYTLSAQELHGKGKDSDFFQMPVYTVFLFPDLVNEKDEFFTIGDLILQELMNLRTIIVEVNFDMNSGLDLGDDYIRLMSCIESTGVMFGNMWAATIDKLKELTGKPEKWSAIGYGIGAEIASVVNGMVDKDAKAGTIIAVDPISVCLTTYPLNAAETTYGVLYLKSSAMLSQYKTKPKMPIIFIGDTFWGQEGCCLEDIRCNHRTGLELFIEILADRTPNGIEILACDPKEMRRETCRPDKDNIKELNVKRWLKVVTTGHNDTPKLEEGNYVVTKLLDRTLRGVALY